ncbi:hypothetical protein SDC9_153164 [bioreactor metagenome]|uniref:Uncharacterized protein n=1 Tax=bioreactor metagenome TaxID=1076179 RepID=A0A645EWU3_9ZZZZ
MLWHWAGFHQTLVAHHTDGKTNVGKLHQQQASPEVAGYLIVTNNPRANHRQ